MTPQEIESKQKEDINWLSERFVKDSDKIDFHENLSDILFTARCLGKKEERQRIKEEIEKLESKSYRGYDYARGFDDCKKVIKSLLEGEKFHSPEGDGSIPSSPVTGESDSGKGGRVNITSSSPSGDGK